MQEMWAEERELPASPRLQYRVMLLARCKAKLDLSSRVKVTSPVRVAALVRVEAQRRPQRQRLLLPVWLQKHLGVRMSLR